jgi:phage terminase large subunit
VAEIVIGDFYKPDHGEPDGPQRRFHSSKAKYPLQEGTRGGGKTLAMMWETIRTALEVPGSNNLLLRRILKSSEMGGIEDHFVKYVPKGIYRSYSRHTVTFHNEAKMFFGHIKSDSDLTQYQGPEYLTVGWDELTQFSYPMWAFLRGSNRCPVQQDIYGKKPRARMLGSTNPNGIGSGWVKSFWIQHKMPAGMVEDPRYPFDPNDYEAIRSTFADNKIYANDAEYIAGLASMPPNLRAAWLEGSWDVLAGQFFSNWEESRHVKTAITFQDWQPRWIGIDWGFNHATCVLWFTIARTTNALGESGERIVCYRELVRRGLNEQALADEIIKYNSGDKIANVYLSPERFNRINEEHTIADRMGDVLAGVGLPRPERANNDRVGGWRLVYTLLDTEGFVVAANCKDLIDSFPQLMRDEKDLEDAAREGNELYLDVCESLRYGLMSYFNPRKVPQAVLDDQRIKSIPDPTWKYMEHLRQQARAPANDLVINVPRRTAPWRRN